MGCSEDNDNSSPQAPDIEVDFITTLGGSKNESAQAVVNTTDGGYAILGTLRVWMEISQVNLMSPMITGF